jgi:hypothetical protein
VPLPGLPWSPEFMEAYEAATKGDGSRIKIAASRTKLGTVNDAIVRYLASQVFAALAPSTRAMRRAVLERLRSEHGDKRIGKLEAEHVKRLLTKMRPWAQRNWLKTLRGLAAFCLTEHLIDTDPTDTVKLAKAKDTGGFEPARRNSLISSVSSARHAPSARSGIALRHHGGAERYGAAWPAARSRWDHFFPAAQDYGCGRYPDAPGTGRSDRGHAESEAPRISRY